MLTGIDLQIGKRAQMLDPWRNDTVEVATLGVPPHITLLYPWRSAPLEERDLQLLEETLTGFEPFELCFDRLATLEVGVIYLGLKGERAPRAMMKAIFTAFPDTPPYGGVFANPASHLTVAKCAPKNPVTLHNEFAEELGLPPKRRVDEVVVMEEREEKRWFNRYTVRLQSL